ncbi:MAG: helix-turn-helix domain-containing protein [Clostridia bacterium]|nr:helix-turn-helix domain-containing protein [Clostridia bacterium]
MVYYAYIPNLRKGGAVLKCGEIIAGLRKDAGLSQEALAERLFVSRSLVAQWEAGLLRPGRRSIDAMAEIFGVDPDVIARRDSLAAAELKSCVPENSQIGRDELAGLIAGFVEGLGDKERNLFIRRYQFFEKPSEIAERYGLSKGAVRTGLFRTRKKLRSFLDSATQRRS